MILTPLCCWAPPCSSAKSGTNVVTIGSIQAGSRSNIISAEAVLQGTCRSFDRATWEKIPEVMTRIVQNIATAYKCTAQVIIHRVTKPLTNDRAVFELVKSTAEKIIAAPSLWIEDAATMGSEDFASFGEKIPIAIAHLGAEGGTPMHSSKVNFHEEAFETGGACYAQFVVDALAKLNA